MDPQISLRASWDESLCRVCVCVFFLFLFLFWGGGCSEHRCPFWLIWLKNRGRFLVYVVVQSTTRAINFARKDTYGSEGFQRGRARCSHFVPELGEAEARPCAARPGGLLPG